MCLYPCLCLPIPHDTSPHRNMIETRLPRPELPLVDVCETIARLHATESTSTPLPWILWKAVSDAAAALGQEFVIWRDFMANAGVDHEVWHALHSMQQVLSNKIRYVATLDEACDKQTRVVAVVPLAIVEGCDKSRPFPFTQFQYCEESTTASGDRTKQVWRSANQTLPLVEWSQTSGEQKVELVNNGLYEILSANWLTSAATPAYVNRLESPSILATTEALLSVLLTAHYIVVRVERSDAEVDTYHQEHFLALLQEDVAVRAFEDYRMTGDGAERVLEQEQQICLSVIAAVVQFMKKLLRAPKLLDETELGCIALAADGDDLCDTTNRVVPQYAGLVCQWTVRITEAFTPLSTKCTLYQSMTFTVQTPEGGERDETRLLRSALM